MDDKAAKRDNDVHVSLRKSHITAMETTHQSVSQPVTHTPPFHQPHNLGPKDFPRKTERRQPVSYNDSNKIKVNPCFAFFSQLLSPFSAGWHLSKFDIDVQVSEAENRELRNETQLVQRFRDVFHVGSSPSEKLENERGESESRAEFQEQFFEVLKVFDRNYQNACCLEKKY